MDRGRAVAGESRDHEQDAPLAETVRDGAGPGPGKPGRLPDLGADCGHDVALGPLPAPSATVLPTVPRLPADARTGNAGSSGRCCRAWTRLARAPAGAGARRAWTGGPLIVRCP